MKKLISRILAVAVVVGVASMGLAATTEGSWDGWITDTHCAEKGAKAGHAECAAKCVKEGGKYALYNPADKSMWVLSNQEEAAKMAGKEVKVKGKADTEKKTIDVSSMEAKK
ncbi:MAG TPA: hypothetical protein VK780_10350 [Thermoanaerobaculia bacterium]|jgi:hypothetical protein|nr:hypothetical protein [Thermoanaerobaculia bacterium]